MIQVSVRFRRPEAVITDVLHTKEANKLLLICMKANTECAKRGERDVRVREKCRVRGAPLCG